MIHMQQKQNTTIWLIFIRAL